MATLISNAAAILANDAIVDSLDTGTGPAHLLIYSGTVPTNADDAIGAQVLLADLTMSATAFGASSDLNPGARATAAAITDDSSANATGTASFFRLVRGAATIGTVQGAVTATGGGGQLELNTTSIVSGALVQVTSLTATHPES